ncbi:MAG: hypothetical protein KGL34_02495, partial [Gammaproteobacteria bacterium]|nr:hypothetical protein [Gammaproteobacteria bacterium]
SVERPAHPFGVAIDGGEVEERVRGLLAAPVRMPERRSLRALLALILALPVVAAPAYPLVHAWIEAIVAARF